MKKLLPFLALLLAALLAACSGGGTSASSSASVPPASSAATEGFAEGTVLDMGDGTLLIEDASANEMLFDISGIQPEDGTLAADAAVRIFYTGTLQAGNNVQPVTVSRVVVTSDGQPVILAGTVDDATMNSLTLKTADNKLYVFPIDGVPVAGADGLLAGDSVEVSYTGTLTEDSANVQEVTVNSITVTSEPASSAAQSQAPVVPAQPPAPAPNPNPPEGYVAGSVVDATMNTTAIQSVYGTEYLFDTADITAENADGIIVGDDIAVYYAGTLNDSLGGGSVQPVTVERVVVTGIVAPPAPAPAPASQSAAPAPVADEVKTLEGTVDISDGDGTFMMSDATGVDFRFSLLGAVVHSGDGGIDAGDYVTVYYVGDLYDKPDVQNVSVTEVVVHQ